jgi:sulfate adenylyltransferase (ADP) / ATP adenylyltransferase
LRVENQARLALSAGALKHIDTTATVLHDAGIPFVVREATNLVRKDAAADEPGDPFARPEPELFVADLSPTHFALLNKYNVLDRHLLVVTHQDTDQDVLLDRADFEALAQCMEDADVVGFYNGGAGAGASQRHKHLQVVKLPLSPSGPSIPIQSLIDAGRLDDLPFVHAFARLASGASAAGRIDAMRANYRHMLEACGVRELPGARHSGPYNLLVTREWMLLVPRSSPVFEGIAVNSLAFAGALFVRSPEKKRAVERLGPMAVLRGVAQARN